MLGTAPRLLAVLAHARDPGNAGTVVRAADAAGAGGVLLTGDSVDPYNGKCVRASAGSLFHLPVSVGDRVEDDLPALRAAGLQVLAADGHADLDLDEAADTGLLDAPDRVGLRQRGLGPARADPGARRRRGQGPDPRPGRVAEPGDRRRGVPLRLGPGAPHSSDRLIRVRPLG